MKMFVIFLGLFSLTMYGCKDDKKSSSDAETSDGLGQNFFPIDTGTFTMSSGFRALDLFYPAPQDEIYPKEFNYAELGIETTGNPFLVLFYSQREVTPSFDGHGDIGFIRKRNNNWQASLFCDEDCYIGNGHGGTFELDAHNKLHIAYSESGPQTGGEQVSYLTNQKGRFEFEDVDPRIISPGFFVYDIELGLDKSVHILHRAYGDYLIYSFKKSGLWTNISGGLKHDYTNASLAIDPDGTPHAVTSDGFRTTYHYTFHDMEWVEEKILNSGQYPTIKIDVEGGIHIASRNSTTLFYSRLEFGSVDWETIEIQAHAGVFPQYSLSYTICIDKKRNPVLIYRTQGGNNPYNQNTRGSLIIAYYDTSKKVLHQKILDSRPSYYHFSAVTDPWGEIHIVCHWEKFLIYFPNTDIHELIK